MKEFNDLIDQGIICQNNLDGEKALEFHQKALSIGIDINNLTFQIKALSFIGQDYMLLGDLKNAIDFFNMMLDLSVKEDDLSGQCFALRYLCCCNTDIGENEKARNYGERGLSIVVKANEPYLEGQLHNDLAKIYSFYGDPLKSIEFHQRALDIFEQSQSFMTQAYTLICLGNIHTFLGKMQNGIDYYNKALEINKDLNDELGRAIILNNAGTCYATIGDYETAENYFKEALEISQKLNHPPTETESLINLGSIVINGLNDPENGLGYIEKAIEISKIRGTKPPMIRALRYASHAYDILHNTEKALEKLFEALKLTKEINSIVDEQVILQDIGLIYINSLNFEKAEEFYNQSLTVAREFKIPAIERTLYGLACIEYKKKNLEEAQTYIEEAIKIIEETREGIADEEAHNAYLSHYYTFYDLYIEVLYYRDQACPNMGFGELAEAIHKKANSHREKRI